MPKRQLPIEADLIINRPRLEGIVERQNNHGTLDLSPSAVHATNFPQLVIHLPQLVIPMSHRTHIPALVQGEITFILLD